MPFDVLRVNSRLAALTLNLAALTVPSALLAQSPAPARDVPFVHPVRPIYPIRPRPPAYPRPPRHRQDDDNRYRFVIDGSVVDRYLATPTQKRPPRPRQKPTPRPIGALDVFETHSTAGNE